MFVVRGRIKLRPNLGQDINESEAGQRRTHENVSDLSTSSKSEIVSRLLDAISGWSEFRRGSFLEMPRIYGSRESPCQSTGSAKTALSTAMDAFVPAGGRNPPSTIRTLSFILLIFTKRVPLPLCCHQKIFKMPRSCTSANRAVTFSCSRPAMPPLAGRDTFAGPNTPLPGLVCTGDSVWPGIGVPAVAASGTLVANMMVSPLKQLRMLKNIDFGGVGV